MGYKPLTQYELKEKYGNAPVEKKTSGQTTANLTAAYEPKSFVDLLNMYKSYGFAESEAANMAISEIKALGRVSQADWKEYEAVCSKYNTKPSVEFAKEGD